jgi:hypothetical protein
MNHSLNLGKTVNYVRSLKLGDHGIFFYRDPQEKREVLFNFLQAGIEKGEGAVYVASQETSRQVRRSMEYFGLDVKTHERDGLLRILDYDNFYIINGEVNLTLTRHLGKRLRDEVRENGLEGLRACGEVACFFEHKKEKELVEYELEIGNKLPFPATTLCAYDVNHAKSLEEKLFFNLIKAHGPVVTSSYAQEVKFENFFPTIVSVVFRTVFDDLGSEILLGMLGEQSLVKPFARIGENPGAFVEGLEELLGSGAKGIIKLIGQETFSEIGLT